MTTGSHILTIERVGQFAFDGVCSCNLARWRSVPDRAALRELHARHFEEMNDAERSERDRTEATR